MEHNEQYENITEPVEHYENSMGQITDNTKINKALDELSIAAESLEIKEDNEADELYEMLRNKKYVFLTGAGGTGKSTLTKKMLTRYNNPVVCASTGAAALNIGGDTVHRIFRLGISNTEKELHYYDSMKIRELAQSKGVEYGTAYNIYFHKMNRVLRAADLVVIDEVSMLSAEHINMIFSRIEKFRYNFDILLVGDFLQLPPVVKKGTTKFAFDSEHWDKFETKELTKVHRTKDEEFIYVLGQVRKGKYTQRVKDFLENHLVDKLPKDCNMLYSLKAKVESENRRRLQEIEEPLRRFTGVVTYCDNPNQEKTIQSFLKNMVTPHILEVKETCRVMFTVNTEEFINGELGTIVSICRNENGEYDSGISEIKVRKDNGVVVSVFPNTFIQYKTEEQGGEIVMLPEVKYNQYPLIVAYATTIHKAQGASIDSVGVDCKGIFEDSQFYVAISRARYADKLYITNFSRNAIHVNQKVKDFYNL